MNTVTAMKPNFSSRDEYLGWRHMWKIVYARLSGDIRRAKLALKDAQRSGDPEAAKKAKALHYDRRVAFKMMTLLQDGKVRRDRIIAMLKEIAEQPFPLVLEDVRNVDFNYNKGNAEFPFLPMWVLRAKGRSYYVHEVEANVPWSTRERASGSTKGVLRFRRCSIAIDSEGVATVREHYTTPTADVAKSYSVATP